MEDLIQRVVATLCVKAQRDGVDPYDVKGVYMNSKRSFKGIDRYLLDLETRWRNVYKEMGPLA